MSLMMITVNLSGEEEGKLFYIIAIVDAFPDEFA